MGDLILEISNELLDSNALVWTYQATVLLTLNRLSDIVLLW